MTEDDNALTVLNSVLTNHGYNVLSQSPSITLALQNESTFKPDIIVLSVVIPDPATLQYLHVINQESPPPIIMFTDESSSEAITEVVKTGISAYVVDGLHENRIISIIETARARFNEQLSLRIELADTRAELAGRKHIERAKGIIMEQRNCSEKEAYTLLRTSAMNQNIRLAELAENIISTATLLSPKAEK